MCPRAPIALFWLVLIALPGGPTGDAPAVDEQTARPGSAAEWWDEIFRRREFRAADPSSSFAARSVERLLREKRLAPGADALVLAMGDGPNAILLAELGLDVTGLDVSPLAVERAKLAARDRGVRIETVLADLFEADLGTERWDLVTNIYYNPAIRVFDRMKRAVRPGGFLLVEGYCSEHREAGPPPWSRYRPNQLLGELDGWRILDYEDGLFSSPWAEGRAVPVIRVLAQKPGPPSGR